MGTCPATMGSACPKMPSGPWRRPLSPAWGTLHTKEGTRNASLYQGITPSC